MQRNSRVLSAPFHIRGIYPSVLGQELVGSFSLQPLTPIKFGGTHFQFSNHLKLIPLSPWRPVEFQLPEHSVPRRIRELWALSSVHIHKSPWPFGNSSQLLTDESIDHCARATASMPCIHSRIAKCLLASGILMDTRDALQNRHSRSYSPPRTEISGSRKSTLSC